MFSVPQERIYSRRVYDCAAAAAYTAEMHTGFAVELVMLPHSEELLVLRKLLYLLKNADYQNCSRNLTSFS